MHDAARYGTLTAGTVRCATIDRFGLVTWEGKEPMLRMIQVDELRRAWGRYVPL
jgi:hypothetical protein